VDDDPAFAPLMKAVTIGVDANFLHWELAFPTVWKNWRSPTQRSGGFDAIIGNPPWDRLKMQEVEWFASRKPEIAKATRAADRNRMVRALKDSGDILSGQYERASEMAALASRMANHKDGQFPLLGKGDTNLYSLFVERAMQLVKPTGIVGLLIPSGIAGDLGASAFFRSVSTTGRLGVLFDYENKKIFFPDVHASFKFCAIVFGGEARKFEATQCGFFLRSTNDNDLAEQTFPLAPADFAAVNPNTGTAPVFRNVRDADLTTAIYARLPVLARKEFAKGSSGPDEGAAIGDLVGGPKQTSAANPWPVKYLRMFDMTNDSHLFRARAELEADGWYPVDYGIMKKGDAEVVPLYEGKMVQAFDHRAASVIVNEENLHRPAQPENATLEQHQNPSWLAEPQFFVPLEEVVGQVSDKWNLAFKAITAPTNMRTMIAGLLPQCGVGNSMGMILANNATKPLLYANLNAFVLDFVARQKVQGQNLNWFIVEQFPVIPPADYDRVFGKMTAREIVAREVLHLTYTAHDMAAFARDMGYEGDPFIWDDADRRQRRARLDALYFHLYGIGKDDAEYILSTFPIVRRHDEDEFKGRYVTRDLILAQMDALAAGDVDAVISLR
ncbi:MAG: restriction endonuclease, partial [Sphingorhabdus sp.]|nr:restriction endonuclease [Sphingorhabdus sp.]